ncbi:MAG TPA: DUF6452 family protein [Chryseosolibacter sp.]|nr:DUF6452 family protein [Chryseosolibacter sp.]
MRFLSRLVLGLFSSLLAISCLEEPECVRINNNVAGITFRNLIDGSNQAVLWDEISMVGTDSIVSGRASVTSFVLSLDYFNNQTTVKFRNQELIDSLVLAYRVQAQFISEECGERYFLSDLKLITHTFDSVRIVSAVPGKDTKAKNIEIYVNE